MKIERINGINHIILDDNDKVLITSNEYFSDLALDIECKNGKLNIDGDAAIIDSIKGDRMIEKVSMPPVLSPEAILKKCDEWLDMFYLVHDTFRSLVLTDRYRKQNITMELSFSEYFSLKDEQTRGRNIDIDLKKYGTTIEEGLTLSIDQGNYDVYEYLIAKVLDHYLKVNYEKTVVENDLPGYNGTLYSKDERKDRSTVPVICGLSNLYEDSRLGNIVTSIITNHNLGRSNEHLISNLRNAITSQQLGERFDRTADYSTRQYEQIVLSKKNN